MQQLVDLISRLRDGETFGRDYAVDANCRAAALIVGATGDLALSARQFRYKGIMVKVSRRVHEVAYSSLGRTVQ